MTRALALVATAVAGAFALGRGRGEPVLAGACVMLAVVLWLTISWAERQYPRRR